MQPKTAQPAKNTRAGKPKRGQKSNAQNSTSKESILSLIEQHIKDNTPLASKIFAEATNAGIKGNIASVIDLISCVEKTASESKLRKFHAKLGAAIIVGGQA
ncbi:hypothetical protein [Photobacterium damselae]|uniref:hypothetical protein n=1 Tax=Photobacterium damselae TaxID=38293 RepID=UPI001F465AA8|nr:hypothetical protein [Photobacterium damselae]UKA04644.1 hypothetical protein IHC89_23785 [Photobacterium damselae subsp. damselae]